MIDNPYIRQLLQKYIDGSYSPEELDELLRYSTQLEGEQTIGALVEAYLAETPTIEAAQEERLQRILNLTDIHISEAVPLPDMDEQPTRSLFRRMLPYAAAVLLFLSVGIYVWKVGINQEPNTISITATEAKAQQVELPDGSHVWLNAGATLTYPEKFSKDKRTITLSDGQAYFDIAKDENKPFTVHAGTLKVEVLGTSFEVTAYNNKEQASVAVKSGTVNVSAEHTPSTTGTTLTANQKATLHTTTGTIETTDIDGDDIAGWKENRLVFSDDDFAIVLEAIQRRYKVTIDLQKPELLSKKITLRLDDQLVQTAIEILSLSTNFKYEFANDSTIIIR
ncbi:FecR family protein [Sphingobacterium faecale]|uniref:FecR domain-containing protein n=1 Tax=Sphingobacterium faecale TaxID=2803775 RepID=A0ABS1R938_9SPHI|nr:FecR domain-containing protein [Sphingobacterium faecale]MBL1410815.1 FecR domain-containing protein [Sphingobacterium faecale]